MISIAARLAYGGRMKIAALLVALAAPAHAFTQEDVVQAQLLPGWRMDTGHHMAGLALELAPHWKTYWRSPGDAGIPPQFDWQGSQNVKSVRLHWPSPTVFHTNGMQTVGYVDGLVLPLEVTAVDPTKPVHLRARVDIGVCNEICMPAEVRVQGDLPAQGAGDSAIKSALKARPETAKEAGLQGISCDVEPIADGLRLTARIDLPARGGPETVVFESGVAGVWVAEAQTARQGGALVSVTELVGSSGAPFALDRSGVTVTVIGKGRAVEIQGCPAP